MAGNITSIESMLSMLKSNPSVLGLIEYGSAQVSDAGTKGDYDLFVVLNTKVENIESLHFFVGDIPVDLNIRSLHELQKAYYLTGFDTALLDGRLIHDPSGKVSKVVGELKDRQLKHGLQTPSDQTVNSTRHGHRHVLDKARTYLNSNPLLVKLLLNTNIYWLIESYYRIRGLQYGGEKQALEYLKIIEPEVYRIFEHFYSVDDLQEQIEIQEKLTDIILQPVGGKWATGEILAFGDKETGDLQTEGLAVFKSLFGNSEQG